MKSIAWSLLVLVSLAIVGCKATITTERSTGGATGGANPAESAAPKAFAKEVVQAIAANWDATLMNRYGSKEYKASVTDAEAEKFMVVYRDGLGPLKNVSDFSVEKEGTENGEMRMDLVAPAEFEKGSGTVRVTLAKEGEEFKLQYMSVDSAALTEAVARAKEADAGGSEAPPTEGQGAPPSDDDDAPSSDTPGTSGTSGTSGTG